MREETRSSNIFLKRVMFLSLPFFIVYIFCTTHVSSVNSLHFDGHLNAASLFYETE